MLIHFFFSLSFITCKNQPPAESISYGATTPSGPTSPHYRSFTTTLDDTQTHTHTHTDRQTHALGMNPLVE